MKIIVVADTHGNYLAPLDFIEGSGAELLIHLGDDIADAKTLEAFCPIPVIMVPGNCDQSAKEPRELLESIAGRTFFITHGHIYWVKAGLDKLSERAAGLKAAVALFGHTHKPLILKQDGVLLVNPGTLMATSDAKSYAILTVTATSISAEIIHLP